MVRNLHYIIWKNEIQQMINYICMYKSNELTLDQIFCCDLDLLLINAFQEETVNSNINFLFIADKNDAK